MDTAAASAIQPQLAQGERLLWSGRPAQGLVLRSSDAFAIPFSLLWGGFAIFWETMVIRSDTPFFFWVWGVPFVLIGLYLIAGRFVVDARQRANVFYGVTNQRIIILSGLANRVTRSLNLRTLSDVSLEEKRNGVGSITFSSLPASWNTGRSWPSAAALVPTFELIDDPRTVFELVRKAQATA